MNNVTPINTKVAEAFRHLDPNKGLGEGLLGGFSSINYRGKIWSLRHRGENHVIVREDDGTPATYLDVIVVGAAEKTSKTLFNEWGGDDSGGPPICQSIDGDVPDPGVPQPQSKSCHTCKHNEWGSQLGGNGRGKRCQDQRRLAVLLMPKLTAKLLGAPLNDPVFFKVPPGSLNTLKAYNDFLKHNGIPFCSVITRISFDPKQLFQMKFEKIQDLTNKEAELVLPLLEAPITNRIIGLQPVMRELPPAQEMRKIERVETGLVEAFAKPSVPTEVQKQALEATAEAPPWLERQQAPADTSVPIDVVESDDELDKRMSALLDKKVGDMLK
jgi:hypothetical protein